MSTTFDEFIQNLDNEFDASEHDWIQTKDAWLEQLDNFYEQIKAFLQNYTKTGQVKIEENFITIKEQYIGEYEAPEKTILLGKKRVRLTPKGTLLIGAKGRVDMDGDWGSAKFVLIDNNGQSEWVIATNPPNITYVKLTEDSFQDVLMSVVNG